MDFRDQYAQKVFDSILRLSLSGAVGKPLPSCQNLLVFKVAYRTLQLKPSLKVNLIISFQDFFDKEIGKRKRAAVTQSIYTSPLGIAGEAQVARKTLLGQ